MSRCGGINAAFGRRDLGFRPSLGRRRLPKGDPRDLPRTVPPNATFSGATPLGATLPGTMSLGATLPGTMSLRATLPGTTSLGATPSRATLPGTTSSGATLPGTTPSGQLPLGCAAGRRLCRKLPPSLRSVPPALEDPVFLEKPPELYGGIAWGGVVIRRACLGWTEGRLVRLGPWFGWRNGFGCVYRKG